MRSAATAASFLAFAFAARAASFTQLQTDELEHLLVDTSGYNDAGFALGVTPCERYISGSQLSGRTSAGQWMRVGFHDFATYDAHSQTGGMDGSIVWETMREENKGAAMNESTSYWAGFVNPYVSMADMIALGTIISSSSCSGPQIPFKGGRKDASGPGTFGVPEPFQPLHEHLERAEVFGFSKEEFIQLTACGHTVGSSHASGFPDVVPQSAITPNNTNGGVPFDSTKFIFDNKVATSYIDDTTTNPFVKSFNETNRSDLRIFQSDNNVTMKALAQSNSYFLETCKTVFAKMINSVPAGVQLRDIVPQAVKPVNVHVNIDATGAVKFEGTIRLLETSFPNTVSRTVSVTYTGSDNVERTVAATSSPTLTGSSIFLGTRTQYYAFCTPLGDAGVKSFVVKITQGGRTVVYDNAGAKYAVTDGVQWLPGMSSASVDVVNGVFTIKLTAAVRTSLAPKSVSAAVTVPTAQIGAMTPKLVTQSIPLSRGPKLGKSGYTLYTISQDISVAAGIDVASRAAILAAKGTTFDIVATLPNGSAVKDEFRKITEVGVQGVDISVWWVATKA